MSIVPPDVRIGESATAELFRLRRIAIVDGAWYLGFVLGFALAGILSLDALAKNLVRSPAAAMALYIITICVAGLAGGAMGTVCGHGVATMRERMDLRRHPRHYEAGAGGA